MTTRHPNALVSDYLRRLEAAAATLPPDRRIELVGEIRAHIDDALREAGSADDITVRNVLERLGPPEEIVAAATGRTAVAPRSRGKLEIAALAALALSGLLPIVGWALGVVLLLASDAWSRRDKVVGLLLGLLATVSVPVIVILVPADGGLGPLELLVLVGWGIVSGPTSAAYLAWRLRHRGDAVARGSLASASAAGD
ncbi:MAG: hypothetical protein QOJ59_2643 [Thermomicrobiales bacterium]|jgi:uncharacterized membrane protein|nr:hypothetical protein [Thermomicrobiales bacterium]